MRAVVRTMTAGVEWGVAISLPIEMISIHFEKHQNWTIEKYAMNLFR